MKYFLQACFDRLCISNKKPPTQKEKEDITDLFHLAEAVNLACNDEVLVDPVDLLEDPCAYIRATMDHLRPEMEAVERMTVGAVIDLLLRHSIDCQQLRELEVEQSAKHRMQLMRRMVSQVTYRTAGTAEHTAEVRKTVAAIFAMQCFHITIGAVRKRRDLHAFCSRTTRKLKLAQARA
jgi:hypothetical protein